MSIGGWATAACAARVEPQYHDLKALLVNLVANDLSAMHMAGLIDESASESNRVWLFHANHAIISSGFLSEAIRIRPASFPERLL